MPILTAPSLGPPHPLPVGRPIDRALETGLLDEGLQHHHRMSVFGLPVPADPARDHQGRALACLVFGAAAWKCQDRDQFIGWTAEQRQKHLGLVTNNTRFLILPWVNVPGLGSWILGQVAGRIARDWQSKYGHPVVVLETFVEQSRFRGTVYRAANWQRVGVTAGRSRQDRHTCLQVPRKEIYLYPLRRSFREALGA